MIVFDSSTLILLAKIDMLELFISNYRGKVLIPEMVKSEVCVTGKEETPLITKLIHDKKIEVVKVKDDNQTRKLMADFNIEIGEAEAITFALQKGANLIATDDRNAIRACKMLKLSFTTAIAILIRAFEKGLIDKAETLIKIQRLQSVGRYSKTIIKDAEKLIKGG